MDNSKQLPGAEGRLLECQLEAIRLTLDRLYWQLSKRDALEGQSLRVVLGRGEVREAACWVEFRLEDDAQELHVRWRTAPPEAESESE